jgi:RNA polymerase sigma-70 factor (ECF subfamily)
MSESSQELGRDSRARFEALALPQTRPLYNTALRLTRRPQDAADLVQETFLRAYRTFTNFTPGTNAKAWLFTIMYSIFVNAYRKKEREPDLESIEDLEERFERSLPIQDLNAHLQILRNPNLDWKGSEVQRELERLPESFRAAVLLVDVEELSYEEAAAALDCPVGTLRSRLFRGRRILAVGLQEYARRMGYVRR